MNMKRWSCVIMIAAALVAAAGCSGKKKTIITPAMATSDEALYKEGERLVKKDPEKALVFFRQVMESFPKSFYAQRAMLGIAETYFLKGDEANLILAASQYRTFLSLYPSSPSAPMAQYRIALCSFNKMLKPGRDQTKTQEALTELKKTIALYPLTDEAKQAREKIAECENRLAESNFVVAEYYFKRGAFRPAISRLTEILTEYPSFPEMDKVFFVLGDSHFGMGKIDEAGPFFIKLVTDYPKSPYVKKAQKRLKDIEEIKKNPPKQRAPVPIKK